MASRTKASFSHPENLALMMRLGLVSAGADEFTCFAVWGKLIRAGWRNESLKKITPHALARLKEAISDNVVEFSSKQRAQKVGA